MPHPQVTSKTPARRKAVRFPSKENIAQVHEVERYVCDKEKIARWYQPREFMQIRSEIDATILELMQIEEDLEYWDTSKYTLRGLEPFFLRRYRTQRREVHKTLMRMVLKAQHEYGCSEEDIRQRIRRLSNTCSRASRRRAQEIGALDQFAAGVGRPTTPGNPQQKQSPLYTPLEDGPTNRRASLIAQQA